MLCQNKLYDNIVFFSMIRIIIRILKQFINIRMLRTCYFIQYCFLVSNFIGLLFSS